MTFKLGILIKWVIIYIFINFKSPYKLSKYNTLFNSPITEKCECSGLMINSLYKETHVQEEERLCKIRLQPLVHEAVYVTISHE